MNLKPQRRMASDILKCGKNRVWIDPERVYEVEEAITRADIRDLINKGVIKAKKKKGVTHKKKKGRRETGSVKGTKHARKSSKNRWMDRIRAIRKMLKKMREEGEISKSLYRKLYYKSKGGFYRNKTHLKLLLEKMKKEGIDVGERTKVQSETEKKA